jgi:hypothetical protein
VSLPDIQYPEFGSDAHKERACTRGDQVKVLGTGAAHFQYTALHAEQGVGAILAGTCNLDAAFTLLELDVAFALLELVALSIDNKI